MSFFKQIKSLLRGQSHDSALQRYLAAKLVPALGVKHLGDLLREHGKRRTHAAQSNLGELILKFYFEKSSDAQTAIESQRLLQSRGIPLAPLVHADASDETLAEFGLACVAYQRIEGVPMRMEEHAALAPEVARMLARMHVDLAPPVAKRGQAAATLQASPLFDLNLKRIGAIPVSGASDLRTDLQRYFDRAGDGPGEGMGGLSFVHNDISTHNILVKPDGEFVLLDLDLCGRGLYGIELAHALVRFTPAQSRGDGPRYPLGYFQGDRSAVAPFIEAYMSAAPESFRADWERWHEYYILWDLVDAVATTAADLASGRETSGAGRNVAKQIEKQLGLLKKCMDAVGRKTA